MAPKIILKGHKGIGGVAEGEALVTKQFFSYIFHVGGQWEETYSAKVTHKYHDWYQKYTEGKVLVFPTGTGGIFSTALLYGLWKHGLAPKAFINVKTHPVFTYGSIMCNIPTVDGLDKDPTEVIETGDWVKVDAEKGIVEVTKKKK